MHDGNLVFFLPFLPVMVSSQKELVLGMNWMELADLSGSHVNTFGFSPTGVTEVQVNSPRMNITGLVVADGSSATTTKIKSQRTLIFLLK